MSKVNTDLLTISHKIQNFPRMAKNDKFLNRIVILFLLQASIFQWTIFELYISQNRMMRFSDKTMR